MRTLRSIWQAFIRYIRELEEYKWEHGSSCCVPSHTDADHNPLGFDRHRTGT